MGFFGSGDKIQTDTTNQVGASEQADLINASGSNISKGVLALTGSNVRDVTISDGGAFDLARDFADNYGKTLTDLVSKQTDTTAAQASNTNALLQNLLAGFGALVESKNTDGASSQNKTVLYIALAIAAAAGIFFWRRSR